MCVGRQHLKPDTCRGAGVETTVRGQGREPLMYASTRETSATRSEGYREAV